MSERMLVAADVQSTVERRLISDWAAANHPDATIVALEDPGFATAVESLGDGSVLPVRVTWLPKERSTGQRLSLGELLMLGRPRRPWAPVQQVITRVRPSATQVTTGVPATITQLRERWVRRYGEADQTPQFSAFVARQALLACDRAERQILGNRYKVPRLIVEQLLDSPSFNQGLAELAETLGKDVRMVRGETERALEELVTVQSPLVIELWSSMLRPLHTHAWEIDTDHAAVERLRELNKGHSLIFLPSHRSYVDPLILGDVLLQHDLPRNHTLGGANLSFWPFGPLGKRAGIVFIRRQFGGDEAYKFAVRRYLAHLMAKRFNLEWFMEGGRSRTGKLRRPKFGILRYLVDGLEVQPDADPVIVPVSIVYEQLHEVESMAEEEMGGAKQAEGLVWFLRYLRGQRQHLGDVLVRFGEPMPLRKALADAGEGRAQLEKVVFAVASRINAVTPATSTSLVTLVLLGERDRALTLAEIGGRVTPLLDYLDTRSIELPKEDLRRASGLRATLDRLEEEGVVEAYRGGPTDVWSIQPRRHHIAAFYRNGALHHLLNRAIVEVTLLYVAGLPPGSDRTEDAWDEALRLRDLLKFEFFFPSKTQFRDELQEELKLLNGDYNGGEQSEAARRVLERVHVAAADGTRPAPAGPLVAHHVLRSFIDAHVVTAEVLVEAGGATSLNEDDLVGRCLALGKQMVRQRLIHGVESISRELFGGTAALADNRGLLEAGGETQAKREAYREEVRQVVERLAMIQSMTKDIEADHG